MVEPMGECANQNLQIPNGNHEEEQDESASVEIEENALKFLDSMDGYLVLMNSLSSVLRQGWLELASARHSMGALRINSALLDLKHHSAVTTLQLDYQHAGSRMDQQVFTLHKWASSDSPRNVSGEFMTENLDMQEKGAGNDGSPHIADDQAQKERLKTLSMFGALVSPKLRDAQFSFETAVETIAEIANARASLLCAYEQVHEEMESSTN